MGISTSARLIFGATYEELSDVENLHDMLYDGDLDYASPYYDADRGDWIIGVALPSEIIGEDNVLASIRSAKLEFDRLTNCVAVGRLIVSAHVS